MSSADFSIRLSTDLALGADLSDLARLGRFVIDRLSVERPVGDLEIAWSSGWLDMTLLAHMGQVLRLSHGRFARISLNLEGAMQDKFPFLWQCGFWRYVRANRVGSRLYCSPDPWEHPHDPDRAAANYTSLFVLELAPRGPGATDSQEADQTVADFVKDCDSALRSTACFPVVAQSDVMYSREYLYLLLWKRVGF